VAQRKPTNKTVYQSMKNKSVYRFRTGSVIITVLITLSLSLTVTASPPARGGCRVTGVIEQYGIGHSAFGDTPLKWRAFVPSDGGKHPAIIVIHGGNFYGGDFTNLQTDQDLVCAGFCVFDIEYRLAPPGKIQGQGRDSGRYPEQTDDVATAIRAARSPAPTSVAFGRVNGNVGAVGGSAGASHAAYCAAAPTLGGDQWTRPAPKRGIRFSRSCFAHRYQVRGNLAKTFAITLVARLALLVTVTEGRSIWLRLIGDLPSASSPVFIVSSNLDSMPPNQFTILVNTVAAVGVPNCENLLITGRPGPDGCTGHSFELWPDVRDQAIAFLNMFLSI
jgi:hypothetical protein